MTQVKANSIYVIPEDAPISQQEITKEFNAGKFDDKLKALKSLVIQIKHDKQMPRMVIYFINPLGALSDETHTLKKILLFYWEVIEKTHSNGSLEEEMILCNSLRKELLQLNEYKRGRTLKLLSKIQLRVYIKKQSREYQSHENCNSVHIQMNQWRNCY